jgi:hypothetical protein
MPNGTKDLAELEHALPPGVFVMRGDILAALGLTRRQFAVLVADGVFVAKYPFGRGTRARFLRSQVIEVAREWQATH